MANQAYEMSQAEAMQAAKDFGYWWREHRHQVFDGDVYRTEALRMWMAAFARGAKCVRSS